MTDCARVREERWGSAECAVLYQRLPRPPTLSAARHSGASCWYRNRPEKHACARALDRALPLSNLSAESVRAIGVEMMVHRVATVNAFMNREEGTRYDAVIDAKSAPWALRLSQVVIVVAPRLRRVWSERGR